MKYNERQTDKLLEISSNFFVCNFKHVGCIDPQHYIQNVERRRKLDNLYNLHGYTPETFRREVTQVIKAHDFCGITRFESEAMRHLKAIKASWGDESRTVKLIERQNETELLHHNYNERLFSGVQDIYTANRPVYRLVRYVIDGMNNKQYAMIEINANGDRLNVPISKLINNIPLKAKRQFLKSQTLSQSNQDKLDSLIVQAVNKYLHFKRQAHKI